MKPGSNIRLRADGRYEARYLKNKDADGRSHYGCVYGATAEEADRKRVERLQILRNTEVAGRVSRGQKGDENASPEAAYSRIKNAPIMDEKTARLVEETLAADTDGAAFGFSLCLYMGISYREVCALKYSDFDFQTGVLIIHQQMSNKNNQRGQLLLCKERKIPIPEIIRRAYHSAGRKPDTYILTDTEIPVESTMSTTYLFKRVIGNTPELRNILPDSLQMTFIRRAVEAGFSYETVEAITGVGKGIIERRFRKYTKADVEAVRFLSDRYSQGSPDTGSGTKQSGAEADGNTHFARTMNLLILGAGSHGHAVMETAEKLGIFQSIKFLDDAATAPDIIGRCEEYYRFTKEYPNAFVAIGNNEIRSHYIDKLNEAGYVIPRIIHPDATISKGAVIQAGTIVLAQATVNASEIGEGCIIASNALIGFGARVGSYSHIDCGGIVMKDTTVPNRTYVDSGEIYRNE